MKLLGLVVVAGCGAPSVEHVQLAPLPPSPTPDQRVWIFNAVRPRGELTESTTTCDRHGGCFTTTNGAIELPAGRTVRDPEDLAPLVAPESVTLAHARKAHRAAGRHARRGAGAITALAGYPKDLAARRSLCPCGQLGRPCEQQVPGAAAPTYAAPATPDPGLDQLRPR